MKKYSTLIVWFILGCFFFLLFSVNKSDLYYKKYIIHNKEKIKKKSNNIFYLENIKVPYYTDITIYITSDSSYCMNLWGNKKSWLWYFKQDKMISCDISYDKHYNKDVAKDIEFINLFEDYGE